jgi:hypothetical protein
VVKAYVMACLSEITYLKPSSSETVARERYWILPSILLKDIIERSIIFDIPRILSQTADVQVQTIDRVNFVYFVFRFSTFWVIAVRGTTTASDWGINLDVLKRYVLTRGYHRGFLNEATSALPELLTLVDNDAPVYFTGHSLGGAVASVLRQFWTGPNLKMTPYIFASPRFGNRAAVTSSHAYGYVGPVDLVPHVPPKLFGFSNYGFPPTVVPDRKWSSGIATLVHWLTPGNGFKAPHAIENYRAALGRDIGETFSETIYKDTISSLASHATA